MAARKRSLGVTIDTGELPSAKGVEEGYNLAMVIGRWQHVAHSSFRNDCRALKQMIAETDELRLWEKNVGGFRFANRDQFLREKVLIDYELTERDMAEIVAMLKRDDPDAVRDRLAACAKAKANPVRSGPGAPPMAERNLNACDTPIKRGGSKDKAQILRRLAGGNDEHKAILAAYERGEYRSARAAGIAAGFIKPPTPLDQLRKAWAKATSEERSTFLSEIPI